MNRNALTTAALSLVLGVALSACGGDEKDDPKAKATPSPTSTVTLPPGVELTEPGEELAFGEVANVEYAPAQTVSSILGLTVTKAVLGSTKDLKGFNLDTDYKKNANYYFVTVSVSNLGDGDLSDRDVPLNGLNDKNTFLPPVVFNSAFEKCPTKKMPQGFVKGQSFETCLVFLSPDKGPLNAVSFSTSPTESITWVGPVETPVAKPKKDKATPTPTPTP